MRPLLKLLPLLPPTPARLEEPLHMRRRHQSVPCTTEEEDRYPSEGGDEGFRSPVLVEEEDEGS